MGQTSFQQFNPTTLAQEGQNVAVPAWGLSCWSVKPISMDWPALLNLMFPATVLVNRACADDCVVFIYHQSVPDRWPFFNCIVTAKYSLRTSASPGSKDCV